jgi:hypothetical protein
MQLLSFELLGHSLPLRLGTVELILCCQQTLLRLVSLSNNLIVPLWCLACFSHVIFAALLAPYFFNLLLVTCILTCGVLQLVADDLQHTFILLQSL